MENNQIDVTKLSVTELKAVAYDLLAQLQVIQRNLDVVNQELSKRQGN